MELELNLLPPEKQEAFRAHLRASYLHAVAVVAIIALFTVAALFLASYRMLEREQLLVARETESLGAERAASNARIAAQDALVRALAAQEEAALPAAEAIAAVLAVIPQGATLQGLTMTPGAVTVRGIAADRETVLEAETRLAALPFVTNVDAPISNILRRTDAQFSFTLTVHPDRLRAAQSAR